MPLHATNKIKIEIEIEIKGGSKRDDMVAADPCLCVGDLRGESHGEPVADEQGPDVHPADHLHLLRGLHHSVSGGSMKPYVNP